MNIIFFGSSPDVLPIIEKLNSTFSVKLVVTTEQHPTDAVPKYCLEYTIPYISLKQFNNTTIEQLQSVNAPLAVLADFGLIVPDKVLNVFPQGILNIHPSLLPLYRGPTPVQTAILNGDRATGVSIIKLDSELDHGSLLAQEKAKIEPEDTAKSLYKRLFQQGADMLVEKIPGYVADEIKLIEQDHNKATYTGDRLTRESGYIDLGSLENLSREARSGSARKLEIERKVRAYFPWPGVWSKIKINNREVRIKLLPNQMIQVEGKKPMNYKDFLNGYPELKEKLPLLSSGS